MRDAGFRAHVSGTACLACHDAPAHASATLPRIAATCHREHKGRVELAATADTFCVKCHADVPAVEAGGHPARVGATASTGAARIRAECDGLSCRPS